MAWSEEQIADVLHEIDTAPSPFEQAKVAMRVNLNLAVSMSKIADAVDMLYDNDMHRFREGR